MIRSVLTYYSRGGARPPRIMAVVSSLRTRTWTSSTRRTLSSFSSFAEPNPTLFVAPKLKDDENAQLRADIKVMGSVLGQVLRETAAPAAAAGVGEGDDPDDSSIFDHVEALRAAAKKWRQGDGDLQVLADRVAKLTNSQLKDVSRAFTHFLALANAAEAHHRIRRLSKYVDTPLFPKDDSCGGVIPSLLANGTATADEIFDALTSQTTELVLTAHPTEVNRRTVLNKNHRIQQILTASDVEQNSYKRQLLDDALLQEIRSLWLTDEVSRIKPSPETEAAKGTLVVETVLWEAVPSFLRKLSATLQNAIGRSLPLTAAPVRFASWMGGDRDGNPNVKPSTTATVCMTNRRTAATLFCHDLEKLNGELSIAAATDDLLRYDSREPYRTHIGKMLQKMRRTKEWATACLEGRGNGSSSTTADGVGGGGGGFGAVHRDNLYLEKEDLWNDLMVMHRSLCATGNAVIADGRLTDILRNVSAFGLPLIPLDVRQESDRHMEALDAITKFLGLGSYTQWDEEAKISWLTGQISNRRPLIRAGVWKDHPESFSDTVVDTLETFAMIAAQHEGSLGAYVISQATTASDVLAVLLLQLDAGVKKPLRVAPLFETLDDLNGAESTMRKLFSLPVYMGYIKGKQEVMIGYSDSAKDAGRLAASWAQYETQEILAATAKEFNVDLTFFHGKGGTVGRGGNPQTFLAIMAHAPDTINGHFRVTEQGEMINQNFGYIDRAERTMDIYTAAVLAEKLTDRARPTAEYRALMNKLSDLSCAAYRKIVREDARFVPYFRSATPELELTILNIGSRPAKRKAGGGVESLRAIPWNFAWTQTRLNLPTWLGVGTALDAVLADQTEGPLLREMYANWSSFRTMIDLVEMVLAKSESDIAKHYDRLLVSDAAAQTLGEEVRATHLATEKSVLELTQHVKLGANNEVLMRALAVRNPYVDCLNVLQAETLRRIRRDDNETNKNNAELKDALLTTITGIANGMGNTG